MFTRRTMMAAAPAAMGVGTALQAQAQAPAPAPAATASSPQAPGWYRYKVGDVEVTAIQDGFARRPLEGFIKNAELADVKKAMAEAFLPEDALPISFTTVVLRAGGRTILIDTGNGDSGPPTTGRWMANFKSAGFDPANVDTILISHFHPDHISGIRLKDGTAVFPKAEINVAESEWDFWTDDSKMASAPEGWKPTFAATRRVFGPIMKDVKRFAPGKEVAPGITSVAANGHTPGHTAFMVSSGATKLMVLGDTMNHPALFVRHPEWSAVFDMDADMARATRLKMLDMAAAERVQIAFYHGPFPSTGHISKGADGYRFAPTQWMPVV